MNRVAISCALVFLILIALAALSFSNHFRTEELTPEQLQGKLATPPEDPCYQLERARASETIELRDKEPVRNTEELSSDEIAIYRILLARWSSGPRVKVYSKTFPLELDRIDCACFKGMDPGTVLAASHTYRYLNNSVVTGRYTTLVSPGSDAAHVRDPQEGMQQGESVETAVDKAFDSGLLSLSQIAFDKEHHRAVVGYSFYCGSLCGSGYTVVLEKIGGEWKQTDQTCGGYIS